jgi:ADP-heptose:LPS heptosyltransferase
LEHLVCEYTEIWAPAAVVPLVRFGQKVRALSETGIDRFGIEAVAFSDFLAKTLQSFDSIVSWYGANRAEFRQAVRDLGIPCEFHAALPDRDYTGHAAKFFAEQVGADPNLSARLEIVPAPARESVVIHPFSGGRGKNWPLVFYKELALRISSAEIEWTAGPEEELPGATRFEDLAGLARWLSGARLYIGNDSGITHLAAAIGIPTLALFGPTDPARWAPRGQNVTILRCEPIANLSVDTVLEAANRLLSRPSEASSI